ncbi:hypothetical protein Y1Q_0006551 [Alligator mississippiensis]|uniref:AP complex mu/sigma subunit domain-containing protein n=1 Tax=Alligator mississippiensis TaxID=8496 RepID=A0A151N250_ALLMI|nr:hypothetical protein Y1Q_0006551 [Alligator mississippiensis]
MPAPTGWFSMRYLVQSTLACPHVLVRDLAWSQGCSSCPLPGLVHYILQEVVMGGMVLETNMNEIVAQIDAQSKLEKSEGGLSAAPARAVSAVKNINLPELPRNINIGDINIKVPSLSPFV